MVTAGYRSMMLMACVLAAVVSAQVTFSKDWTGGKRSPPAVFDCGQFARICRQFVYDLKQALPAEKLGKHRRVESPPDSDDTITYDDDK